ncbi:MAG TPA: hypothetical protein VMH37_09455, partial [Candidatus Binataceae bacterium]|nr:hypothetical protein [Candidatus Binataceae bacterium]
MECNQADWTEVGIRSDLRMGGMARVAKAVKVSGAGELGEDDQRGGEHGHVATAPGLCGDGLDAQL